MTTDQIAEDKRKRLKSMLRQRFNFSFPDSSETGLDRAIESIIKSAIEKAFEEAFRDRPPEVGIDGSLQPRLAQSADTKPLEELIACLEKYQVRYHGAPHAQKLWDRSARALDAMKREGQ